MLPRHLLLNPPRLFIRLFIRPRNRLPRHIRPLRRNPQLPLRRLPRLLLPNRLNRLKNSS
jgi:hypothetical protein